jgi:hypothetical protein
MRHFCRTCLQKETVTVTATAMVVAAVAAAAAAAAAVAAAVVGIHHCESTPPGGQNREHLCRSLFVWDNYQQDLSAAEREEGPQEAPVVVAAQRPDHLTVQPVHEESLQILSSRFLSESALREQRQETGSKLGSDRCQMHLLPELVLELQQVKSPARVEQPQ